MNLQFSAGPNGTKNQEPEGFGGGPNLLIRNVFSPPYDSYISGSAVSQRTVDRPASSTAGYYMMDGLTDFHPYSLREMSTWGNDIADAKGFDYFWPISCDHPADESGNEGGWGRDATAIYIAFSNDPAIPPDPSTMCRVINGGAQPPGGVIGLPGAPGTGRYTAYFNHSFVFNDFEVTNKGYFYLGSMNDQTGTVTVNSLNEGLFVTPDLDNEFIPTSLSHACATNGFGLTSYQQVYQVDASNFYSYGGGNKTANDGSIAKWVSTDGGQTFDIDQQVTMRIGGTSFSLWERNFSPAGFEFTIDGQKYISTREDVRGPGWSSGTTYPLNALVSGSNFRSYRSLVGSNLNNNPVSSPSHWEDQGYLGEYVTIAPIDANGSVIGTGTPPITRISNQYRGEYPQANYLQYVPNFVEGGIAFFFAIHGMFGDTGLVGGRDELPENGGGINEQYVDIYAFVIDAVAAADSAPCGVRVSASVGIATIQWYDVPGGRTFRTRRYASLADAKSDTSGTTVGDVTGTSITDSPTPGFVYYYRVAALNGGVEQGFRIVSTYVS